MTACALCGRDPVLGGSTLWSETDGRHHPFCHPTTEAERDGWSCFETVYYTAFENQPHARRPPRPLDPILASRALVWLGDHAPDRYQRHTSR